jgi:tetratricopeptide (TPR) repeat protein
MSRIVLALFALAYVAAGNTLAQLEDWKSKLDEANDLRQTGQYQAAVTRYREVIKILDSSGLEPLQLTSALNSLGMTYDDLGQYADAEKNYRRALQVIEVRSGMHSVSRAQVLVNFSGVYFHRGQLTKAETLIREALTIYSDLLPADSMITAVARSCLAQALLQQSHYEEAATVADQALAAFDKKPIERGGYYGICLNTKGSVRWLQRRPAEAVELFEQSVAAMELERGKESPQLLYPLNNLAVARERAGRPEEAVALLSRAMEITRTNLGAEHPIYGDLLMNYANCLSAAGHKAEAKKLKVRAAAILKANSLNTGAGFAVDVSALR